MVKQQQLLIHVKEIGRKDTANTEECTAWTRGILQFSRQIDVSGKIPSFPKGFSFALAVLCTDHLPTQQEPERERWLSPAAAGSNTATSQLLKA